MTHRKIYYIEDDENYITIKKGLLINIIKDDFVESRALIREPIDKYRPEHFHTIPLYNTKEFVEKDEIDFLNDLAERIHERLLDLWYELEDIKK